MHYNNPLYLKSTVFVVFVIAIADDLFYLLFYKKTDIQDQSGFRIYTTENYRTHEFGIFVVGASASWF